MINLTSDEIEKLRLIDNFLKAVTIEELRTLTEGDLIVGKLRGIPSYEFKALFKR